MDYNKLNKGNIRKLETFEKGLLEEGLLKFKGIKKENMCLQTMSYKGFIETALTAFNPNVSTLYADNNSKQCSKAKRRSAGDIFRITKYYYPQVTLKQVLNSLSSLALNKKIRSSMCEMINKRVYYASNQPHVFQENEKDEFNHTINEYL